MSEIARIEIRANELTFPALSAGSGPLVLLLHGFPDCPATYRHQLGALARAGYRAVAPTLRGYDPACQPRTAEYHIVYTAEDAAAIVRALGAKRAHLVGHDWGAAACYLAARLEPRLFASITTLAVPHPLGMAASLHRVPRQLKLSWYMFFFQLVGLSERSVRKDDFALLERLWRDWSPSYAPPHDVLAEVKATFAKPRVVECALAYYRELFRATSEPSRRAQRLLLAPITQPLLALTGEEDGCISTNLYDHAMTERWLTQGVVERMRGVGHFLHLEAPERVSERLITWLRENDRAMPSAS